MPSHENDDAKSESSGDTVIIDHDDVSNYNPDQMLPEPPESIKRIRSWLQPTSYDVVGGEYHKHLNSHVVGTGQWLTSTDTYQEWLQGEEYGLLWIKGIPGSGKSVMAAMLIDEITRSNPGCPVLFFFFRQIIDANHTPQALLRDWMDQLLDYSPPLQKQLKTYLDGCRPINSISTEDLWKDLRMAFIALPGKVFCIADALDEIDRDQDALLKSLSELGNWRPEKVKVLITSRPIPRVELPLSNTPYLCLRLREDLVDVDISKYVQFTLSNSNILQKDWETIINAVPGRANGLFLYAKLAMDAFLEPSADVKIVLSHLPRNLNILYSRLLEEHAKRSRTDTRTQNLILQSIIYASRPLRALELAEIIRANSPDISLRDTKASKGLIRNACGPLLEILPDETVSVVHHSFTEYLKGTTGSSDGIGYPIIQMGSAHTELALACLSYLQNGCLETMKNLYDSKGFGADTDQEAYGTWINPKGSVSKEDVQLRLKYPFFEYAANSWHHHINMSEASGCDQTKINEELHKFLSDDQNLKAWTRSRCRRGYAGLTQLHVAAAKGLNSYVRELLASSTLDIDAPDRSGRTALWWASKEGHAVTVRELIRAGANPDQERLKDGIKPLHKAASRNHFEVVRVLLDAGVDPLTPKSRENPGPKCGNYRQTIGHPPLMYACLNGHLEAVEAFLPFLKNIDTIHRALAWAASHGRSTVVARILKCPGVNVNVKVFSDTPLYLACNCADLETIEVLLRAGADPNIACVGTGDEFSIMARLHLSRPSDLTCLQSLCQGIKMLQRRLRDGLSTDRILKMATLLIEAGADVHYRGRDGRTLLHEAVDIPILTRVLLDAGVDANETDDFGESPLHKGPSTDSLVLLVEEGHADIDLAMPDGSTPLLKMLSGRKTVLGDTIIRFLEYGPSCEAVDNNGCGVLHAAFSNDAIKPEVIRALLNAGANPNLKNGQGLAPLHLISTDHRDSIPLLDLLVEAGADINATDRNGATLLVRRIPTRIHGPHEDLRSLIDRGASTNVRDIHGRTCLHEAVRYHRGIDPSDSFWTPADSRLDFLIGLDIDTDVVDHEGNNLLHEAASKSINYNPLAGPAYLSLWAQLVSLGLDLAKKNHNGRTPLHLLCSHLIEPQTIRKAYQMPIDFLISQMEDLDIPDNHGITPLHLAVATSEIHAKKLLDAGANPLATSHEGLNPLHIASRHRQSNIVGLLLDKLRERNGATSNASPTSIRLKEPNTNISTSPVEQVIGVNARAFTERETITPLYLACRSGRPETVALLLEAGADPQIGDIFKACTEFEEEDSLWEIPHITVAVTLDDNSRPGGLKIGTGPRISPDESTRLEDIIEMLMSSGGDIRAATRHITWAVRCNMDYTATCLRNAQAQTLNSTELEQSPIDSEVFVKFSHISLTQASVKVLRDYHNARPGESNCELFRRFLVQREYNLVEELLRLEASSMPLNGRALQDCLEVLIEHGFCSLFYRIATSQAESDLNSGNLRAFGGESQVGLLCAIRKLLTSEDEGDSPMPFLLKAVSRQLPNMVVVQLLVETFLVNVNELYYTYQAEGSEHHIRSSDSALHRVARGSSWWQVYQALPYLLKAGADVNILDHHGQSPLHEALGGSGIFCSPYHTVAAKTLIEYGADVNAIDNQQLSCLTMACHNIDMTKLLIERGAVVTPEEIFSAIDAKEIEILDVLLSQGVDPNLRREYRSVSPELGRQNGSTAVMGWHLLERHEIYPIYEAAMGICPPRDSSFTENRYCKVVMRLVLALLNYGADPFAKFLRLLTKSEKANGEEIKISSSDTPLIHVPPGYKELTVLHDLCEHNVPMDDFFSIPGLDANHRDAEGRTVLHVACGSTNGPDVVLGSHVKGASKSEGITVFQRLVDIGADLEARDNYKRNALHHMIMSTKGRWTERFSTSMNQIIKEKPVLVNQADGEGKTPLHYAISWATQQSEIEVAKRLLHAGADPLSVDNEGDGVLHLLSRSLDLEPSRDLFRDLVQRGVDINARNKRGETPLFGLPNRKKQKTRRKGGIFGIETGEKHDYPGKAATLMLKDLGADFFARDSRGQSLLHKAAMGDVELFRDFLDMGLDITLEDNAQQTAIDVAASCENQDVLQLFDHQE